MATEPHAGSPDDLLIAYQEALRLGHQALLAGKPRDALGHYERAASLADDRPLPHLSLGRALLALDRPADALAAFERAIERGPHDSGALQGKAEALGRLGRQAEAEHVVDQLQQLAGQPSTRSAALELDEGALPRAEVLSIAAERAWHDRRIDTAVDQWLAAARAYAADGHHDAALEACQRALLADAADARVHLEMCRLYVARGWLEPAIERMELLTRLLDLEPADDVRRDLATLARSAVGAGAQGDRLAALAARLDAPAPA